MYYKFQWKLGTYFFTLNVFNIFLYETFYKQLICEHWKLKNKSLGSMVPLFFYEIAIFLSSSLFNFSIIISNKAFKELPQHNESGLHYIKKQIEASNRNKSNNNK